MHGGRGRGFICGFIDWRGGREVGVFLPVVGWEERVPSRRGRRGITDQPVASVGLRDAGQAGDTEAGTKNSQGILLCQKQAEPSGDTFDQLFTTKRCGLGGAGGDMRALKDSGPDCIEGPGGTNRS